MTRWQQQETTISAAAARKAQADAEAQREKLRRRRRVGVQTTQPIKDPEMIARWLDIAKAHDARRPSRVSWYLLLVIGFNTGLRISDIVSLRVREIRGHERLVKVARKTGKETSISLLPSVRRKIDRLLEDRDPDSFVFESQIRRDGRPQPITRVRAYRIIRTIAEEAGYTEHVGCHTMRKTYAYSLYQSSGQEISIVQQQLNHSTTGITLHYIGVDQEAIDAAVAKMPALI